MSTPEIAKALPTDFFIPGLDPGFALVRAEDLTPRLIPPLQTEGLTLVTDVEQRLRTFGEWLGVRQTRLWAQGVAFPTVLCVADDVGMMSNHLTVCGKYFLSSAGGTRVRNRYAAAGPTVDGLTPDKALIAYLNDCAARNTAPLPVATEDVRHLPFVIEVKNFGNFYHFTKESFPLLTLVERYGLTGPIVLATGSRAQAAGFVQNLIDTWFPDLVPRIEIRRGWGNYGRSLVALDTAHFRYQAALVPGIEAANDPPVARDPDRRGVYAAAANSFEEPVDALRRHVHARIGSPDRKRRLYVKRRSDRVRGVLGEERLLDRLAPLGFETVFFEDMTVREQAATVASAECLVTLHGAGMTNMLFVPPGCLTVELSNCQTLLSRYGDFNPLALSAGAFYLHAFMDHDFPDPSALPIYSKHGLRGVSMSDFAVDVLASRIHAHLVPDMAERALEECRALNSEGQADPLREALARHETLIFHDADTHVWHANCAPTPEDTLLHLRRALHLAPRRLPLLKRAMTVAHKARNNAVFQEALAAFLQAGPRRAQAFLEEKGWSAEGIGP
ncbi:glycosyltransferase family 61 protein [Falsirhodobacter sp. 20TX0035]|uniref:glycosyltransferase family 61 protein n=1 Tax=Falsirhodobacter sp. 20TX0035 TaxID=3022019 RepID=UPI0023309F3A|nr:glycosyltransferase family 61 protein [Falsirhodobacter sp. 20TX0035]MDB6453594.1 glycosyltransferase family 61 protein [Falsirhodobacter sp. 20TX0035]